MTLLQHLKMFHESSLSLIKFHVRLEDHSPTQDYMYILKVKAKTLKIFFIL